MRKLGGVHTPHNKSTAHMQSELLPIPPEVVIPMSMHTGAPAKPVVAAGDIVKVGQLIAEAGGSVSSPVHSSVSGKVMSVGNVPFATGEKTTAVRIASDGGQTLCEALQIPAVSNTAEFLAAVRDSGVVGLGGAGYPTYAKLRLKESVKLDYIIVNGAECEPYITSDTRTMVEDAQDVYEGILLLKEYIPAGNIVIGIEDNKAEAIAKMRGYCAGVQGVEVKVLPSQYPQGERKVLVYNVTGRVVPEGARLPDVGCIVINCTTLAAIAQYIRTGLPLVSRRVTVDGSAVSAPKNVIAPIGAPVSALFDFCGGFTQEPKKILAGGPMMGIAIPDVSMPVVKTTNAVLALNKKDAAVPEETVCIRCGRCMRNCPMKLMPVEIETAYRSGKPEWLDMHKVNLCLECGCCAYVCPAKRQLTHTMKLSKRMLDDHRKPAARGAAS